MKIAVIGAGIIGTTVARRWQGSAHDIVYAARDPQGERYRELASEARVEEIPVALENSQAVFLAVPGGAVSELLETHAAALDGKLLIDASNDTSGGSFHHLELFERHVPNALVYRAFSSLGWENFADPVIEGERADLFYSGPAGEEQSVVESLIADVGLRPVYLGSGQRAADALDGVTRLWFTLALAQGKGRRLAFRTLGLT